MTGAACGAGNAYLFRASDFTSGFHRGPCCPVIYVSLFHVIVLTFGFRVLNVPFVRLLGIYIFSSPEHSSSELIPWHSVHLSTFHILNFSRTAEGIYSELATNVPYEVPTKYCYFSSWCEIQYGCPGLWLADTFWTSSQERLKGSTPNLPQIFLMRF